MNFGVSSLLLGFLILPQTASYPPGSCDGYTNLTQPWRNKNFVTTIQANDDWNLRNQWWRFTGIGGDRIIAACIPPYYGGTVSPLYVPFVYPTSDSATPTTGTAYGIYTNCQDLSASINVVMCPGGFYIYQPFTLNYYVTAGYVTYHYNCQTDSCGPNAMCSADGGCVCVPGMAIPYGYWPDSSSYGCSDINECQVSGICGPASVCANTIGSYICSCQTGYIATNSSAPPGSTNPCTDINECLVVVCENGQCVNNPGSYRCACYQGYQINTTAPTVCQDIDECLNTAINCGPYANCTNTLGSFTCTCLVGFIATNPTAPVAWNNLCLDIDECLQSPNPCGPGTCLNNPGSYSCACYQGYFLNPDLIPQCQDINECQTTPGICGPYSNCTNTIGSYGCTCLVGFTVTYSGSPPSPANPCIDTDECLQTGMCGPYSNCTNTLGSYLCSCLVGFIVADSTIPPAPANPCTDINECLENICGSGQCYNNPGSYVCVCYQGYQVVPDATPVCQDIDECTQQPGICGAQALCDNEPGTFCCYCPSQFYPSTGVAWVLGTTVCKNLNTLVQNTVPPKGKTKQRAFLDQLDQDVENNVNVVPAATVGGMVAACMVLTSLLPGPDHILSCMSVYLELLLLQNVGAANVSSEGDGETGGLILNITERLVASMVSLPYASTTMHLQTPFMDLSLVTIGPGYKYGETIILYSQNNSMEINLYDTSRANDGKNEENCSFTPPGFAGAGFWTLNGIDTLLSKQYFKSQTEPEMFSAVVSALLLPLNNAHLTQLVNFTLQHKDFQQIPQYGTVSCVYWDDGRQTGKMQWATEGCWPTYSNETYTVCSCSHLSTFALIMQIGEPPPDNPFIDWLNRVCVTIGLFFLTLAIITFLLCSWNPKINNTARLHLCINLALSQLLILWDSNYLQDKLACKVMAGLLHFLVIASFVWMLLEALQLFLLVRKLTKVQVIQRDGLPRPLLYAVGYGVPLVIVGVSALVYSDGYGATAAKACWLMTERNFNWALTGPVIGLLAMNWVVFCATLWSLRPTLANMKSDVSQSKDTRLIMFKILAQFVILGCTWVLGLYQTNIFFEVLFIILNSQQGTFLYIIHCLLNKEVREEYIRFLTSLSKDGSVKSELTVSEDLSKAH
ncbi:adhesion G protein-coupled receptor E2-like [Betta splendens]|uniref:Adhesion G protein-coupled receptor E2-like n=1 Tax=Betta splendens TaxID=158456 RepID=A0A9W2XYZ1_BETSP|nr:adhesion G protein-coupled receptor E2-like [Betta splendens]